jgi:hypothetical protein
MPRELRPTLPRPSSAAAAPYPAPTASLQRNAAIWNAADDEILLQARQSGLNWQPIANRHFPNKTANACRKRHERLIERRHVEDWDAEKLEMLAQEYLAIRKEMWMVLASRVDEKWTTVEAKVRLSEDLLENQQQLTIHSAWRKASKAFKPPRGLPPAAAPLCKACHHSKCEVLQTTTATRALASKATRTLRWS